MRRHLLTPMLACASLMLTGLAGNATAGSIRAPQRDAEAVVTSYFGTLNAMLAGANARGLASVYAPNAVLTLSTPAGSTKVIKGLPALTAWYTAWASTNAGSHFTRTGIRSPLPGMVISYDYTGSATKPLIGRCAHTFSVSQGKIVTDDWVVYFIAK